MILKRLWHETLKRPYRLHKSIDTGDGQVIVLLHGLNARGLDWSPLVRQLDKSKWHVIAFDLLGFGDSPKPIWANYDVDEHARAVVAAIKRARKKQPVVLVGHSMGCLVAAHVAAKWPKLVSRLVLYEPPLYAETAEYKAHLRRKKVYYGVYGKVADGPQRLITYTKVLGRVAAQLVIPDKDTPNWLAFERSLRNTILQQRAYDDLIDTTIRTDIIYGRVDVVVSRTKIKAMFAKNAHITVRVIHASHNISPRAARFITGLLSQGDDVHGR